METPTIPLRQHTSPSKLLNTLDFCESFVPVTFGTVTAPFRIPTFSRKCREDTTWIDLHPRVSRPKGMGALTGLAGGMMSLIGGATYLGYEIIRGNYTLPIAAGLVFLLTNTGSKFYELVVKVCLKK